MFCIVLKYMYKINMSLFSSRLAVSSVKFIYFETPFLFGAVVFGSTILFNDAK